MGNYNEGCDDLREKVAFAFYCMQHGIAAPGSQVPKTKWNRITKLIETWAVKNHLAVDIDTLMDLASAVKCRLRLTAFEDDDDGQFLVACSYELDVDSLKKSGTSRYYVWKGNRRLADSRVVENAISEFIHDLCSVQDLKRWEFENRLARTRTGKTAGKAVLLGMRKPNLETLERIVKATGAKLAIALEYRGEIISSIPFNRRHPYAWDAFRAYKRCLKRESECS